MEIGLSLHHVVGLMCPAITQAGMGDAPMHRVGGSSMPHIVTCDWACQQS